MIELTNCPICDVDDWYGLDRLRDADYWRKRDLIGPHDAVGFKVCRNCGFVTYDYQDDAELKRRYAMNRTFITVNNLLTQNRKMEFHEHFLKAHLAKINESFLDYGCSIGSLVDYASMWAFDAWGLEMNEVDRKVAIGYGGIKCAATREELPDQQWGGIAFYHVLEHLQHPEEALQWAFDHLGKDGFIYVAVPIYGNTLEEASGSVCEDWENLYHLNHVNCFSYQSLKNLFSKVGLDIVQDDRAAYGYTCILKRGESVGLVKEDYTEIEARLEKQKKAVELLKEGNPVEATEVWPCFPDAWIAQSLKMENYFDFKNNTETLLKAIEVCGEHPKILEQLGSVYLQWDEVKKGEKFLSPNTLEAERIFKRLLEIRPGNENVYFFLGIIEAHYKKDPIAAKAYLQKAVAIHPGKWAELENIALWAFQQ